MAETHPRKVYNSSAIIKGCNTTDIGLELDRDSYWEYNKETGYDRMWMKHFGRGISSYGSHSNNIGLHITQPVNIERPFYKLKNALEDSTDYFLFNKVCKRRFNRHSSKVLLFCMVARSTRHHLT